MPVKANTYAYSDDGIRVRQSDVDPITGTVNSSNHYLVDDYNSTGYAQVLEEKVDAKSNGKVEDDEVDKSYVVGHDVIAQAAAAAQAMFLMVDGHGSTRALLDAVAQIVQDAANNNQQQLFAYDAYGNLLMAPGLVQQVAQALTTLLYSGEQTDAATGLQYLRARYYSALTGTFNRLDPFAGNFQDPPIAA